MTSVQRTGNGEATANEHLVYRPDIDGLRAVAVLAVVAFHAFPQYAQGGLVGVDVFFVISGFLISTIIFRGLAAGRFNYVEFYVRRIRRIFPALFAVLAACLIAGWLLLFDQEYAAVGKHVAGGSVFISNFVLWSESGYFDSQARFKTLLHLWSLGIEEQFYLLWPLLLALTWRFTRRLLPLIAVLLVASFVCNVATIAETPRVTFYWPHTRFWELMIGALLAWLMLQQRVRLSATAANAASIAGAALLLMALAVISERSLFPGWLALLPTCGAALLIAAGPAGVVNRWLLMWKPMVFVGLISYPLYLWHWPLLSFARILNSDSTGPGRLERAALVVASFALAWLTWRFLEAPVRTSPGRRPAVALLVLVAAVGLAGWTVFVQGGLPGRAINATRATERALLDDAERQEARLRQDIYRPDSCEGLGLPADTLRFCESFGRRGDALIVLWGDSHAWAWAPVFYKIAREHHLHVVRFSVGGCPPLLEARRGGSEGALTSCYRFGTGEPYVAAIRQLAPHHLYWIGYWNLYAPPGVIEAPPTPAGAADGSSVLASQLLATLSALPPDLPITLFRTTPVLLDNLRRGLIRGVRIEPTVAEHAERGRLANLALDQAAAAHANVSLFDPAATACIVRCLAVWHNTVMYFDAGHISAQGSLLFEDILLRDQFPFLKPD